MNLQGVLPPLLALLAVSLPGAHAAIAGLPTYEIGQSAYIAPITSTKFTDYYMANIGPAAWVCTDLDHRKPEVAYDYMKNYFDKGNKESVKMMNDTWPVIETKGSKNELCVYLEKKYHCYPPEPNDVIIRGINEHLYRHYYGRVFWGQASDARVTYEEGRLKEALGAGGITKEKYKDETRYLAYYPNHVREVRYDAKNPDFTELPVSTSSTKFVTEVAPGIANEDIDT